MLASAIIDQTLNEILLGTYRAHFNALANDISDTDTTVTVMYGITGISENAYIEIDGELMYVVPGGLDATAKTMGVIRGARGTFASAHLSGDGVAINPRFPRSNILNAIREEIKSWPTGMFFADVTDLDASVGETSFDLQTVTGFNDIIRVIKVFHQPSYINRWVRLTGCRQERGLQGDGSVMLFLPYCSQTMAVRAQFARKFDPTLIVDETSDTEALSLPESCIDILKYGAAWRLVNGRETRRLFTEVESEGRLATEVPAGGSMTLARQLKQLRDTRLGEEIFRLRSQYGFMGMS